jgi:hypothetical protein
MNYYILTSSQYNNTNRDNIKFKLNSIDKSKVLISTTENISNYLVVFSNIEECSQYTQDNHSEWSGDGYGFEEFDIECGGFIEEVDD